MGRDRPWVCVSRRENGVGMGAQSLIDRFWSKADCSGGADSCWLWSGRLQKHGYGSFRAGSRTDGTRREWLAHRMAWVITHGDPGALLVLHRCDVRRCVNPGHLWTGTNADNMADMKSKGRADRVRKARGERQGSSKLTDAMVVAIRADARYQRVVAESFGISQTQVSRIRSRRHWVHV